VDAVRDGRLEAGLVALPVDDHGLDVTPPVWTAEVVYASAHAGRLTGPVSVQQLAVAPLVLPEARWGAQHPTRRQLVERARAAGVTIDPVVEVELPSTVLDLASRGVADAVVSRPLLVALGYADRLGCVPLDPPMHETFAFVTRRGAPVSPASAALITLTANLLRRLSI
jgi:DNA-binding transcriptional LysR family regulator